MIGIDAVLRGVRDVLLLRERVTNLEKAADEMRTDLRDLSGRVGDLHARVLSLEAYLRGLGDRAAIESARRLPPA